MGPTWTGSWANLERDCRGVNEERSGDQERDLIAAKAGYYKMRCTGFRRERREKEQGERTGWVGGRGGEKTEHGGFGGSAGRAGTRGVGMGALH